MTNPAAEEVVSRLSAGLAQLEPLLSENGFRLAAQDAGKGSGGYFATAEFAKTGRKLRLRRKADRKLRLWLRNNSLSAEYDIGGHQLEHGKYMRELLGAGGSNRFPSYSDDS